MTFGEGFVRLRFVTGIVALVSGGLDSLVLIRTLQQRRAAVHPVYVRCGLWWESVELWWLRRWLAAVASPRIGSLTILDIPMRTFYGSHWSVSGRRVPSRTTPDAAVYLPGRNVMLLGAAGLYAAQHRCSTLTLGTLSGNPFADAAPRFFSTFAASLSDALSHPLAIEAPLRRFTKAQVIAADPEAPSHLTFSCLRPEGKYHCGRCNKCAERRRAFRQARVPDPTTYAH